MAPKHWSSETWWCSMKGHVAPGATVAEIRPEDAAVARPLGGGQRLCRCMRCDLWIPYQAPEPDEITSEQMPEELPEPKRGKALDERIVVRAISLERWLHVTFYANLAILLIVVEFGLPYIHNYALQILDNWQQVVSDGRPATGYLAEALQKIVDLDRAQVAVLLVVVLAYGSLEGTEAFFLWRGKRWAEYLTVVASVSLMPLTIVALIDKVTVFRLSGLLLELAILAYLIFAKRLFGVRGGYKRLQQVLNAEVDWDVIHAEPPVRAPPVDQEIKRAVSD